MIGLFLKKTLEIFSVGKLWNYSFKEYGYAYNVDETKII